VFGAGRLILKWIKDAGIEVNLLTVSHAKTVSVGVVVWIMCV
jgi:hypothetical protein